MSASIVFKILSREVWRTACAHGEFLGSNDDVRDGFIHLSAGPQLQATAGKYFHGQPDLLLVAFDAQSLGKDLRWEPSRGGDLFPHLYAGLPTAKALWTKPIDLGQDGNPILPPEID